jgi:hypothetical protein
MHLGQRDQTFPEIYVITRVLRLLTFCFSVPSQKDAAARWSGTGRRCGGGKGECVLSKNGGPPTRTGRRKQATNQ